MNSTRLASSTSTKKSLIQLILLLVCFLPFVAAVPMSDYLALNNEPTQLATENDAESGLLMPSPSNGGNRAIIEFASAKEIASFFRSLAQAIDNSRLNVNMMRKRGLDLGLSRGFSGSKVAKHLMGLNAAQFANGPGKKR